MHPERQKPWPKWHRAEFLGSLNPNLSSEQLTRYLKYLPQIPAVQSQLLLLGFLHSYCTAIFRPSMTMGVSNVAWLWGANPYVEITVKIVKITWQSKPWNGPPIFCLWWIGRLATAKNGARQALKEAKRYVDVYKLGAVRWHLLLLQRGFLQREKPLVMRQRSLIIQDWNQLIRRTQQWLQFLIGGVGIEHYWQSFHLDLVVWN